MTHVDEQAIWDALSSIVDPEIPVLSLVELRIIRSFQLAGDTIAVLISPSFVGCPALDVMKVDIGRKLAALGFSKVKIETTFTPPWSTDMLDEAAREKLTAFGIAPPPKVGSNLQETLAEPVPCPFCSSTETTLESSFGSTLCRQIYYCNSCRQSFDRFKPI